MNFMELRKELKEVSFESVRSDKEDCFEAVLIKSELVKLVSKLEKYLGPAVWPSAVALAAEISGSIQEFGGITQGQTLYFLKEQKTIVFAMLWPWGDGIHVTFKLGTKAG